MEKGMESWISMIIRQRMV